MQTLKRISDGAACKVHHTRNRTSLPLRNRKTEKDCGAQRCRNRFLNTVFSNCVPGFLVKDYEGKPFNILTEDNYEYLLGSYLRYAELTGVKARHVPGRNIGESIDQLVYDMETLLKDDVGVNIEQQGQRLYFNLWKCHEWGEYTLYYFPVKFVEGLNTVLRRIAISFINGMANANGIATILDGDDTEMVLDWIETDDRDEPEDDTRRRNAIVSSYRNGKIRRLLQRVESTSYYKNLPAAIRRYSPQDGWEAVLLELMEEGLQFLFPEKPIMRYCYDPFFEEEPDYRPSCKLIFFAELSVGSGCWVKHAGADISHMHYDAGQLQILKEFFACRLTAFDTKAEDAAGSLRKVLLCSFVVIVAGKSGIFDPIYLRMLLQELS